MSKPTYFLLFVIYGFYICALLYVGRTSFKIDPVDKETHFELIDKGLKTRNEQHIRSVPVTILPVSNHVTMSENEKNAASIDAFKVSLNHEGPALASVAQSTLSEEDFQRRVMETAIDGRIMVTICDIGYLSPFLFFHKVNKMSQYRNFVTVVLDKKGYRALLEKGISVVYFPNTILSESDASVSTRMWTSGAFNKMVLKVMILQALIAMKLRVFYVDCDMIIFKDPFPYLKEYEEYDMVGQQDETLCAGLLYLQPTEKTVRFLNMTIQIAYEKKIMDQDAMVFVLNHKVQMKWRYLPMNEFMNGREYSHHHQFFWDHYNKSDEIVTYHNNFVIYARNKIYKWREQGFYTEDDGFYSKYEENGYFYVEKLQTPYVKSLKQLASLSEFFNRVLILPKFVCPPLYDVPWCNLCSWDDTCSYRFQRTINFKLRAHQFIYDSRIPDVLKQAFKNPVKYSIQCGDGNVTTVQKNTIILRRNPNILDLQKLFIGNHQPLIYIESLSECIPEATIATRE